MRTGSPIELPALVCRGKLYYDRSSVLVRYQVTLSHSPRPSRISVERAKRKKNRRARVSARMTKSILVSSQPFGWAQSVRRLAFARGSSSTRRVWATSRARVRVVGANASRGDTVRPRGFHARRGEKSAPTWSVVGFRSAVDPSARGTPRRLNPERRSRKRGACGGALTPSPRSSAPAGSARVKNWRREAKRVVPAADAACSKLHPTQPCGTTGDFFLGGRFIL